MGLGLAQRDAGEIWESKFSSRRRPKRLGLGRLLGGHADLAGEAFAAVEERLHWGQFGLDT